VKNERVFQDPGKSNKPDKMKGFSKQLESFSLAARMAQPIEALDIAQKVIDGLPAAKEEIGRFAPPLSYIIDQIEGISKLSAREPAEKQESTKPTFAHSGTSSRTRWKKASICRQSLSPENG